MSSTTKRSADRTKRRATSPDESSSALGRYLAEVGRAPLLTREEEAGYASRARAGDRDAVDALVRANLRFVVSLAMRYRRPDVPLDDLINEGNLGLIRAAERFDEARGVRFITYAAWWIRQSIIEAIAQSAIVRAPRHGGLAGDAQNARASDGSWIATWTRAARRPTLSLDAPIDGDSETPLADVIADDQGHAPSDALTAADLREAIARALASLGPRDRTMVMLYFGLGDAPPLSPEDIATRVQLSPAAVRQRIACVLERLRRSEGAQRELAAFVA